VEGFAIHACRDAPFFGPGASGPNSVPCWSNIRNGAAQADAASLARCGKTCAPLCAGPTQSTGLPHTFLLKSQGGLESSCPTRRMASDPVSGRLEPREFLPCRPPDEDPLGCCSRRRESPSWPSKRFSPTCRIEGRRCLVGNVFAAPIPITLLVLPRRVGQNPAYWSQRARVRPLACALFGAPAWQVRPRDQWIWLGAADQPNSTLGLGSANHTRFLGILPWCGVPHFASHILSPPLVAESGADLAGPSWPKLCIFFCWRRFGGWPTPPPHLLSAAKLDYSGPNQRPRSPMTQFG